MTQREKFFGGMSFILWWKVIGGGQNRGVDKGESGNFSAYFIMFSVASSAISGG
jgi:hypothetical protein